MFGLTADVLRRTKRGPSVQRRGISGFCRAKRWVFVRQMLHRRESFAFCANRHLLQLYQFSCVHPSIRMNIAGPGGSPSGLKKAGISQPFRDPSPAITGPFVHTDECSTALREPSQKWACLWPCPGSLETNTLNPSANRSAAGLTIASG